MNFDKNTGIIEMFMESLGKEDEGTFTFQLQDGKATNQSSLVLIGDGTNLKAHIHVHICISFIEFVPMTASHFLQCSSSYKRNPSSREKNGIESKVVLFLKLVNSVLNVSNSNIIHHYMASLLHGSIECTYYSVKSTSIVSYVIPDIVHPLFVYYSLLFLHCKVHTSWSISVMKSHLSAV